MTLKNSAERWGQVSQWLHWLVAVLVVVMAWLGLTMADLPNTPYKLRLYLLHKSIGLSLLALVALRLLWRAYAGAPRPLPHLPAWQARLAAFTHGALYALLFALPISGWAFNSAAGFPLRWFNLFALPSIAAKDEALRALARGWHQALFWTLLVLVLAHAAAAIYHHLFQRDATLARMLPRGWLRDPSHDPETPHA